MEQNESNLTERLAILETSFSIMQKQHETILEKLDALILQNEKNKGFWAGVVAAGTALGAALGALVSYIFHYKVS